MENNNFFLTVKAMVTAVCAAFTAAFGWLGWMMVAWVVCMLIDWISGSAAAAKAGEWSSEKARAGIWHKTGMILVVLVAAVSDAVLAMIAQNIPGLELHYSALLLPLILMWYIFTELGSIAENAALLGAPVPAWLVKVLVVGKKMVDDHAPDLPDTDEKEPEDKE